MPIEGGMMQLEPVDLTVRLTLGCRARSKAGDPEEVWCRKKLARGFTVEAFLTTQVSQNGPGTFTEDSFFIVSSERRRGGRSETPAVTKGSQIRQQHGGQEDKTSYNW